MDSRIAGTRPGRDGAGFVDLEVVMTNQDGQLLAKGPVEVRFDR